MVTKISNVAPTNRVQHDQVQSTGVDSISAEIAPSQQAAVAREPSASAVNDVDARVNQGPSLINYDDLNAARASLDLKPVTSLATHYVVDGNLVQDWASLSHLKDELMLDMPEFIAITDAMLSSEEPKTVEAGKQQLQTALSFIIADDLETFAQDPSYDFSNHYESRMALALLAEKHQLGGKPREGFESMRFFAKYDLSLIPEFDPQQTYQGEYPSFVMSATLDNLYTADVELKNVFKQAGRV